MVRQLEVLVSAITEVSVLWGKDLGAAGEEGRGLVRQGGWIWGSSCPCKEVVEPKFPLSPAFEAALARPDCPKWY